MKTIKFRFWDGSDMYYPDDLYFFEENGIRTVENGKGDGHYSTYDVMQFTGLQDKNGKDIYEGDIIDNFNDGNLFVIEVDKYGIILYSDGNKQHWNRIIPEPLDFTQKHIITCLGSPGVIIGNIHENPELLTN